MIVNQRIEDATKNVQSEGRGLCRVLAVGVLLAVATVAGCVFTGCALLDTVASDERTQELFDRALAKLQARLEEKADKPTDPEDPPIVAPDNKADEVAYASLRWDYGGFNGSKALMDANTRISNLTFRGNSLYFKFAQGSCVTLGAKSASDTGSVMVCVFFKDASGSWRGGKFDWIADNRNATRELHHVNGSTPYSNWQSSWIPNPAESCFVLVSMQGRRSNVIKGRWQR
jgi:hypothetical protein